MQQEAATPAVPESSQPVAAEPSKPAVVKTTKPKVQSDEPQKAMSTLEAPASPLAGSKEQRLQQLLQQYKADQITPEQYHQQRAKIIAE